MIHRVRSDQLHPTAGYHHVTTADPGRLVFFAGQMPVDDTGEHVVGPDDLDAQVDRTVVNTRRALAVARVRPEDVVRSVVYVVSTDPARLGRAWRRFAESAIGPAFTSASTLLGVTALGYPQQLVELELTAVL